ncbi:MAG: hypothetical protein A2782_03290 [Candidatus Blackburnbacteria bacterium RIFCSPHIGHO2_01_FULL_43_15b]|uniref:Uncharacterized protein n=1 Tax=Candidatus Blackburnbacteria bacterium RIFCSPHIGHO2_01_FULL_43_15b TaxID=1797513 RepID=A0A1G1V0A7_9BACT|nr:MAG: hypothetical protein A2782_03290 [Candidatus Blackburnbacteria bacterium RIFCSPHIGHO2_01_FULL_43_15b]
MTVISLEEREAFEGFLSDSGRQLFDLLFCFISNIYAHRLSKKTLSSFLFLIAVYLPAFISSSPFLIDHCYHPSEPPDQSV